MAVGVALGGRGRLTERPDLECVLCGGGVPMQYRRSVLVLGMLPSAAFHQSDVRSIRVMSRGAAGAGGSSQSHDGGS